MSHEPAIPDLVEVTRGNLECASRRDLDAVLSSFAPDAVWEALSLGTSFEGVAAIRGFLEDWLAGYQKYEIEPEEILDLGNGVVFAVVRLTGLPHGSVGSVLVRRRPLVFRWAAGSIARVTAPSSSIEEARSAARQAARSTA